MLQAFNKFWLNACKFRCTGEHEIKRSATAILLTIPRTFWIKVTAGCIMVQDSRMKDYLTLRRRHHARLLKGNRKNLSQVPSFSVSPTFLLSNTLMEKPPANPEYSFNGICRLFTYTVQKSKIQYFNTQECIFGWMVALLIMSPSFNNISESSLTPSRVRTQNMVVMKTDLGIRQIRY